MTRVADRALNAERDSERRIAMVSHELRTPTSAIIGWAEMICRKGADGEIVARGVEAIARNARLLARLVEQLTDFSRARAGQADLDFQTVALAPAILAAIETMTPLAGGKSVAITAELDPSAGSVLGDPACLQQVFTNILSNAVKFSREGGRVEVRLARRGDCVELTVSDHGCGISPEFLPYVFDPFRRGGDRSLNHQGLGLGLAIARQIVERHGGEIHAESGGEGAGATFTIRLCRTGTGRARTGCRKDTVSHRGRRR
jgi:signal transduction histidine kinase